MPIVWQLCPEGWLFHSLLTFGAVIALYPVLFTVMTSLKTRKGFAVNPYGVPLEPTLGNYIDAFLAPATGQPDAEFNCQHAGRGAVGYPGEYHGGLCRYQSCASRDATLSSC